MQRVFAIEAGATFVRGRACDLKVRNRSPLVMWLCRDGQRTAIVQLISGQPLSEAEWQIVRPALGELPLIAKAISSKSDTITHFTVYSKVGIASADAFYDQIRSFLINVLHARIGRKA